MSEKWKQQWNHQSLSAQPTTKPTSTTFNHPRLSRKESLDLFTTILDLYALLVEHYEDYLLPCENSSRYKNCTLSQVFNITDYVMKVNKKLRPFLSQFLQTQVGYYYYYLHIDTGKYYIHIHYV